MNAQADLPLRRGSILPWHIGAVAHRPAGLCDYGLKGIILTLNLSIMDTSRRDHSASRPTLVNVNVNVNVNSKFI